MRFTAPERDDDRLDLDQTGVPARRNAGSASLGDLVLESGALVPDTALAYESFGQLDADRSNAVLVFHGLAAGSHIARSSEGDEAGWWEGVVGPGLGLDTDRWCVIVPDVLGGNGASTGPKTLAADGRPWAERFPVLTIRDQVAAAARLGQALGIQRWTAVVGASFGGMHALEWHLGHPGAAGRVAAIAAPWVTTAEQLVQNSLQADIVRSDPAFHAGRYAEHGTRPLAGLALARKVGMLAYRGEGEFDRRFGRTLQPEHGHRFAVESYFSTNAAKFASRFDANAFLTLVEAKNSHDLGRGRGSAEAALGGATAPLLVIGIESDRLFPLEQQRFLARHSPGSVTGAEPALLRSGSGHDSFLIDQSWIGARLAEFLDG